MLPLQLSVTAEAGTGCPDSMSITNVKDRYQAWRDDPETSAEPTLASAFAEGFIQAMELATGELRAPGNITMAELTADW